MIRMTVTICLSEEGLSGQELYEKWKKELEKIDIKIGLSDCDFEALDDE